LVNVVAPGTLSQVSYTVPSGKVFHFTSYALALSKHASTYPVNGQARLQIRSPSGSVLVTLVTASLKALASSASLSPPITVQSKDEVAFTIQCDNYQPACEATATIAGLLSS
jgi:hypothetical protein